MPPEPGPGRGKGRTGAPATAVARPGDWRAARRDVRVTPDAAGARGRPPTPRRLRRMWERQLPWAVMAVLGFVGAVLFGYGMIKIIQNGGGADSRGAFWLITLLGVLAVILAATTFLYTFRKRSRRIQEGSRATMMSWFKAHIWLGLLAFGLVIAHVLVRPITWNLSTGKLALIVFFLLVLSGIVWRIVYRRVPPSVARGPRNLAIADTDQRLEDTETQIVKVAAGKSAMFRSLVQARLHGESPEVLAQRAAELPDDERAAWVEVNTLAYNRQGLRKREERQRHYAAWLQRWKLLHIPLAAIFVGLVVVHILDVFGAGKAVAGGRAAQFPSSQSCATCHADIAREWKSSVMAHGVTSPFMVAQTALAVQKNLAEGHALGQLCVNCHGPIGASITGSDTLPFPGTVNSSDPEATGKHDLILAEGVSCVVCHALGTTAPGVGTGADPFPVDHSGNSSLGRFQGPPQSNPDLIPVPDHQVDTGGFMSDDVASSELCGACHVVDVDINHDGHINRFANPQPDLVLQTTYLEWKHEYLSTFHGDLSAARGCVSCHTTQSQGPIVSGGPFGSSAPDRTVQDHTFFGVDYDLVPGHPGISDEDFDTQLTDIDNLLQTAASMNVSAKVSGEDATNGNAAFIAADVRVTNIGDGHQLPTGFAFVRQMWVAIRADVVDANGKPVRQVCLADVTPLGGTGTLASPCSSGEVKPTQDLDYCDASVIAADQKDFGDFQSADAQIHLAPGAAQPPGRCDPWLASWQKILTDGPAPKPGQTRQEVAYQSKLADIVRTRHRVFDNLNMQPMGPPGFPGIKDPKNSKSFVELPAQFPAIRYDFLLQDAGGKPLPEGTRVKITATLDFRHLPPYFIRSLSGFYPPGITPDGLISGLRIVNMTTATTTVTVP